MDNPRLRHLTSVRGAKKPTVTHGASDLGKLEAHILESMREKLDEDWVLPSGSLDPTKLIETAQTSPMAAARWCQCACKILGQGHQRRINAYISAAYSIACRFRNDDKAIASLAAEVVDGRTKEVPLEKVADNVLHYVCIFIFFQSGLTTRNRATQYAEALQGFYDDIIPHLIVDQRLQEHKHEMLYRAAARRKTIVQQLQARLNPDQHSMVPTMDQILGQMKAEVAGNNAVDLGVSNDFGSAIPLDVNKMPRQTKAEAKRSIARDLALVSLAVKRAQEGQKTQTDITICC